MVHRILYINRLFITGAVEAALVNLVMLEKLTGMGSVCSMNLMTLKGKKLRFLRLSCQAGPTFGSGPGFIESMNKISHAGPLVAQRFIQVRRRHKITPYIQEFRILFAARH